MKLIHLKNRITRYIRQFTITLTRSEYPTPRMEYRVRDSGRNSIELEVLAWRLEIGLPSWVKPYEKVHTNPHLEGTPEWQNYYAWTEKFPKVFGWYLYGGHHFVVSYGRKTHSSSDTQMWSTFLPWTQQRLIRKELIDATTYEVIYRAKMNERGQFDFDPWYAAKEAMAKRIYHLEDYDGTHLDAAVHLTLMEYRRGEGWFRWLSWFTKNPTYGHMEIEFSAEVGSGKGSWKGGLLGMSFPIEDWQTTDGAMRAFLASRQNRGTRDGSGLKYRTE